VKGNRKKKLQTREKDKQSAKKNQGKEKKRVLNEQRGHLGVFKVGGRAEIGGGCGKVGGVIKSNQQPQGLAGGEDNHPHFAYLKSMV